MNLVEGEVIEQIEEVVEGWWSGVGQGGTKTGLFPCMCSDPIIAADMEYIFCCSQLCGADRDAGSA